MNEKEMRSKERLARHSQLENDIMELLKGEGVDIQMARTAMDVVSFNLDEMIKDFLVQHPAKEVLKD